MPSAVIGALRVALGLDSAQFISGADAAERRATQLSGRIRSAFKSSASEVSAFAQVFSGLSVAVGGAALGAVAQRALEYASSLAEVAQQLGVTTKDLQEYRYAASQVGISQELMDKGLAKLTLTMGQAREGVDKPKAAFKELSDLLGKDVLKNAATAGDAIPLIADALAKVEDPAKRAAIEVALFGKTGQQLDTLLAGGSESVNGLRDAARDLGIVLSDEQIQNADAAADKLSELKQVLEANIASAVATNASSIYEFVAALEKLIGKIPAVLNELGKLRAYLNIAQAVLNGSGSELAAARGDLTTRQNFGKPFFGDAANRSVANYIAQNVKGNNAGAGTSDADAKAAAKQAAAEAKRRAAEEKRAAEKAARDEDRYQDQLASERIAQIRANGDLATEIQARADYQQIAIDEDRDQRLAQIARDRDLSEEQKKQLSAEVVKTAHLESQVNHARTLDELAKQDFEAARARNDNEQDVLSAQSALARTAKQRRSLELQLLDLQFKQLRANEEAVLASQQSTEAQKKTARERLSTLGTLQGLATQRTVRETNGPLASYLDALPRTGDEINEAVEGVATHGLDTLIDGIATAQGDFKKLGDVVGNVADQIIADLVRIGLQKGIAALLGSLIPGAASASSFSASDFSRSYGGPLLAGARASGGPVVGGRSYLVGERGYEVFTPQSSGQIIANDDLPITGGGTTVHQSISFTGAVDLATRTEVYRVADAARAAAIRGIKEVNRRRG